MRHRSDLRVLQELKQPPAPPRPHPSTARMPQFMLPGNSASAMRRKLEGVKVDSSDIEAKLRALKGAARAQKARSKISHHQRDWLHQSGALQQERAAIEKAHLLWRQTIATPTRAAPRTSPGDTGSMSAAASHRSNAGSEVETLSCMRSMVAEADDARREWSVAMRCQLADLRQLCQAPASERVPARTLLDELRLNLDAQSHQLADKATALEAEIAAHVASFSAADDDPIFAPLTEGGAPASVDPAGVAEIAALSGAFISPPELRSAGEQQLLEELGSGLLEDKAKHELALEALAMEFFDVARPTHGAGGVQGGAGGAPTEAVVAGDYFVLAAESEEGPEGEGGEGSDCGGDSDCDSERADTVGELHTGWQLAGRDAGRAQPPRRQSGSAVRERLAKLERDFQGRGRAALLERAVIELPGLSAEQIESRLDRRARKRGYAQRRRGLLVAWEARRQAAGRSARVLLQEQAATEGREQVQRGEAEALEAHRQALQAELMVLEQAKAAREAEEAVERKERETLQEAVAEARLRRADAERAHKRALIEQYRAEKAEISEIEAARALATAAEAEQERLQQAERNLDRVQFRAEQLQHRQQLAAVQREAERVAAEETAKRLQRVRDNVVASMNIASDPARVAQATAASAALTQPRVELFRVNGYSEQTLMRDMRYKLSIALSNAGLTQTNYGRQVLTSAALGAPSRPDAIESSIKLG